MFRSAATQVDFLDNERLAATVGTTVGFTAAKIDATAAGRPPAVYAYVTIRSGTASWLSTGATPDTNNGNKVTAGDSFGVWGHGNLKRLSFWADGGSIAVDVQYGY